MSTNPFLPDKAKVPIIWQQEITQKPEEGERNIDVWRTGLAITRAVAYIEEGKPETAKQQLDWVIIEAEHKEHLHIRKEQAQKVLESM